MAPTGLDWLLDGFVERTPGARHAVAVSGDGLLVASSQQLPPERSEQFAAVVAGVVALAQGVAGDADKGPLVRTVVQMRKSILFVMALSSDNSLASLAVVAAPDCNVGQVVYEMSTLVDQVGKMLSPTTR
jgi:predicted regulator of Ras-like GTPase activity (Roadblock/LC7/MglB family)